MTVHTGSLNVAILAALHTDNPHADTVGFEVVTRAKDNTPTLYRVTASRAGTRFASQATTPAEALRRAMALLKAADTIEPAGEVAS